ncbi:MAG: hypothetical protein ABI999_17165 [Acidobacteriota bacterium]
MAQEQNRVDIGFMVKPNALPAAAGCIALGIVILGIGWFIRHGLGNLPILIWILSGVFIGLGFWFLCGIPVARRRLPRSLSAKGIEYRNGSVVPWGAVSSIAEGPQFLAAGNYYREQTNIDLRDGSQVVLTGEWIENYSEMHEYLVARPEYEKPEKYTSSAAASTPGSLQPNQISPIEPDLVKTKADPADQPLKTLSGLPRINVNTRILNQIGIFVGPALIIGMGLFVSAVPFIVYPKGTPMSTSMSALFIIVGLGLIALGCWIPFSIRNKRKAIPRFFSADGIGIWDGTVIQWEKVYLISDVVGSRYVDVNHTATFRQTDIKLRDGNDLSVSADSVSNFDDLHAYLAKLPQYNGN